MPLYGAVIVKPRSYFRLVREERNGPQDPEPLHWIRTACDPAVRELANDHRPTQ